MHIGELVYSLITLILMVLIVFSPILRKIFKSAKKTAVGRENRETDSFHETTDSPRESLFMSEPEIEFSEPASLPVIHYENRNIEPILDRLNRLSPLKKAVVWKEILDKPPGLDIF